MALAYLLLGSNMGERNDYIFQAEKLLEKHCGPIIKKSSMYQTEPWGIENVNPFLNKAIILNTLREPIELLKNILSIEKELGRIRIGNQYESRTIDIDIMFIGNMVLHTENLVIPHPRLTERRFVLVPMVEIAPDFVHPILHKTLKSLLEECKDRLQVDKLV
jgi:2-amino-4-hydroxy-6-hydroxymethyldihydropteridine diphosphokinase